MMATKKCGSEFCKLWKLCWGGGGEESKTVGFVVSEE
jgi:hypothetical protein